MKNILVKLGLAKLSVDEFNKQLSILTSYTIDAILKDNSLNELINTINFDIEEKTLTEYELKICLGVILDLTLKNNIKNDILVNNANGYFKHIIQYENIMMIFGTEFYYEVQSKQNQKYDYHYNNIVNINSKTIRHYYDTCFTLFFKQQCNDIDNTFNTNIDPVYNFNSHLFIAKLFNDYFNDFSKTTIYLANKTRVN